MNRITLKNIKHSKFASQETHCYEASVYFDGKKAGTVSNDGRGGCDHEDPTNKEVWNAMEQHLKTLPEVTSSVGGGETFVYAPSLETVCGDLINTWLAKTDMKRLLSDRVLFTKTGKAGIFQTNCAKGKADQRRVTLANWAEQIINEPETDIILNQQTEDFALELFQANI